jgi:hypothetical protein
VVILQQEYQLLAQVLQADLAKLGIVASLKQVEPPVFLDAQIKRSYRRPGAGCAVRLTPCESGVPWMAIVALQESTDAVLRERWSPNSL